MTGTEYNLFDESDNSSDLPKKLRAKIKELQDSLDEANGRISEYTQRDRTESIGQVLQRYNLNPKIADLVPKDIEGEALDQWVADYADVFGVTPPAQQASQPAYAGDVNRMAALEQSGQPSVAMNDLQMIEQMSPEELLSMLGGR